jgi:hypothetical protein
VTDARDVEIAAPINGQIDSVQAVRVSGVLPGRKYLSG